MLLFLNQWKNYPTAIVDYKTRNISFIKLANLYKQMGIKNHAFILALVNPALQGIDPFSEYLTFEQKLAISFECKINPWYYFREVARAPLKAGAGSVPLEANRGNIALFWLFFNHVTLFLIQIRQSGKSFSCDSLTTLLLNILCNNTQINLLTKDDKLRSDNIQRLKDIDAELPAYLRQRTSADINNTEFLSIKSLKNSFNAHVPQKSEKAANNLGRGLTSPIFLVDEGPFQSNVAISVPAAVTAGTAARDMAAAGGHPYGTVFTTTAGKKDDRDGKYVYKLVSEAAEWTELFFDTENEEALVKMIRLNSRTGKPHVNCTFNHIQLGKSNEWLAKAIEAALVEGDDADRDFFNMWTSGSQTSPLSTLILAKIRQSQSSDFFQKIDAPYNYITKWYIPENEIARRMANGKYILGMDSSDASGGDDISLVITDISTGEVICAGNYNETNLITFSEWVCSWFVRYENITGIIERKSSGVAILDYLLLMLPSYGIDPFKRLFNLAVNEGEEDKERWKEINVPFGRRRSDIYTTNKKTFGFITSGSGLGSRSELYSTTLQLAAKKAGGFVKDKTTIDQITSLVIINNRVDHPKGSHDDMVIAWLLCFWFITLAKNLSFYGIDSKTVFSELDKPTITTQEEFDHYNEQAGIRKEIIEIDELLNNTNDEFIMLKLEQRLRFLNKSLVLEQGEVFSVDELINSVKEKKRTSMANRNNTSQYGYNQQNYNNYRKY